MASATLLNTAIRLTEAIYYGDPSATSGLVPSSRVINATYPVRIDGGASADLSADRTLSVIQSPVGSNQDSVGVNRIIDTVAPLQGGGPLSTDLSLFMLAFDGSGQPGYVPDPGPLGAGYFLDATGAWVFGTGGGVPTNRTLTMGEGLLIDGLSAADLSADRTITLELFDAGARGGVPASGGGTTNFLRADQSWADPFSGATGFVTLQPTTPGSTDVGNAHVSGVFLADLSLGANTLAPLGRVHGVQSVVPDANAALYALSGARYAKATSSPVQLGFRRSRGSVSVPTVGLTGDGVFQILGELYTTNNGFSQAPVLSVFQDGACLNAAGFASKMFVADGVGESLNAWLTTQGLYLKAGTVATQPSASGRFHLVGTPAIESAIKSSNYTLTADDGVIYANCAANSINLTLPNANTCKDRIHFVRRIDSTTNHICYLVPSGGSIETVPSYPLLGPLDSVIVASDGTQWRVLAERRAPLIFTELANGATVANTTTETDFGVTAGFPQYYPYINGQVARFRAGGIYSLLAVASVAPTIRVKVKAGASVMADSGAISLTQTVVTVSYADPVNAAWEIEGMVVLAPFPAAPRFNGGKLMLVGSDGAAFHYGVLPSGSYPSTWGLGWTVTWQWGTANAGNTATLKHFSMELLNAGQAS